MVVYLKVLKILHEPFSFRQNLQKNLVTKTNNDDEDKFALL